ncbi:MAG: phage portal protein [Oscillospiraceae bacterium]|nr:phage portal protein [Oscillospiraceae bacterium]MBQ8378483.1 phage portal protein [Oscillospiraceae bacterium]MBQ8884484.1 phage portal protein [Oscillospiraceae bacterium]
MENNSLYILKDKLTNKSVRVRTRYQYYDMKNSVNALSSVIPDNFKWLSASLGWCAKAVDTLADRTVFDSFDNDDFKLNEIYKLNNSDVLFDSAILSALISSCSFIYIGKGADGYPMLQVIDGANATGIIDPVTNMLKEGYAVLERDENDNPILEAYFRPYQTDYYVNGKLVPEKTLIHKAPSPLLVPVIYRPDAKRPFGHSRISRACMNITQSALRTLIRSEVSAEFYSVPQKYVLGLSEDAEFNNRAATLSSFLNFSKDEDGDKPSVGQFQQQSMAPYIEQLKSLASIFAGETGLTLDDLGFATSNPSSHDAIKASHENLRLTARKAQRTFGTGFLNAGYLAACLRDDNEYDRKAFANTKSMWLPIFEPDASSLGVIGDAILKVNQASPGFLGDRNIKQLTGMESDA